MATKADYTAVANAILAVLNRDIAAEVPSFFQDRVRVIAPQLAGECAKVAVDALDVFRAKEKSS